MSKRPVVILANSSFMFLSLMHKSKNRVFWPVVYVFSGINVVLWALVLTKGR